MMDQSTDKTVNTCHLFGKSECLVLEGAEADLHKHLEGCEKNPGHKQFIPIKSFNVQDLPEDHRDHDLCELIKAVADMSVTVDVKMTSPKRPQFWPGTNDPYPFYNMGGKKNLRCGSGRIRVYKYTDGYGYNGYGQSQGLRGRKYETEYKTCPCEQCQNSDKPNNVWWEIIVGTATHVVFDDTEASHTSCRLFYDEKDSPVVTLDKFNVNEISIPDDRCFLKCVTCDSKLGARLDKMDKNRCNFQRKVWKKYNKTSDDKLCFIVSHPHGCTKQVSIGKWVDNHIVKQYDDVFDKTRLTYTTCTCQGSSGAYVHCIGSNMGHVHIGVKDDGYNYSGEGLFRK